MAPTSDCGGLDEFLARLETNRRLQPLAADEKEEAVELPGWFHRTGIRNFEVDTGLGRVKCRVPKSLAGRNPDDKPKEEEIVPFVVRALRALPQDWRMEETVILRGRTYAEGAPVPAPDLFYDATLEEMRDYLDQLPKSLPVQVMLGLGFMQYPPLPLGSTASAS